MNQKILVVDDDPDIREIISESLSILGCHVDKASGGDVANEFLKKTEVDIVVSDIRMPGGDGVSLLSQIRSRSKKSPLVFLISGFSDYSVESLFSLGADGLIMKPFGHSTLKDALTKSILQPSQRLAPAGRPAPSLCLKCEFDPSTIHSTLRMGRNGFSCLTQGSFSIDERVAFTLVPSKGRSGTPPWGSVLVAGEGLVRWQKPGPSGNVICGIEFLSLADDCRDLILDSINTLDPLARIPPW